LIRSEEDILAQIKCTGPTAIEDWLSESCELAGGFDGGGNEDAFERILSFAGWTAQANYTIWLEYPFELSALREEAERAEHYFRGVSIASTLDTSDATIGDPDSDDDLTAEFAEDVLGVVPVNDVVAALGCVWRRVDIGEIWGSDGEKIYAWFVPADQRPVALGSQPATYSWFRCEEMASTGIRSTRSRTRHSVCGGSRNHRPGTLGIDRRHRPSNCGLC
jgi:hypothetical protein